MSRQFSLYPLGRQYVLRRTCFAALWYVSSNSGSVNNVTILYVTPGTIPAIRLRACYAMSGTDL
eukprot:1285707-Rhodomonas_salina.3